MLEMGSSKGDWLMNNRLDFFKRITAFLLVLLLVTTMMGDDFFSLATSDEIITEETAEGTDANAEPDDTSVPKTVDVVTEPVEGEEPGTAEITEEASPVQPELQEASETPADNEPVLDENGNPIITEEQPIPETPEKTDESNNDEIKTPEPEKIDDIVENDNGRPIYCRFSDVPSFALKDFRTQKLIRTLGDSKKRRVECKKTENDKK